MLKERQALVIKSGLRQILQQFKETNSSRLKLLQECIKRIATWWIVSQLSHEAPDILYDMLQKLRVYYRPAYFGSCIESWSYTSTAPFTELEALQYSKAKTIRWVSFAEDRRISLTPLTIRTPVKNRKNWE